MSETIKNFSKDCRCLHKNGFIQCPNYTMIEELGVGTPFEWAKKIYLDNLFVVTFDEERCVFIGRIVGPDYTPFMIQTARAADCIEQLAKAQEEEDAVYQRIADMAEDDPFVFHVESDFLALNSDDEDF